MEAHSKAARMTYARIIGFFAALMVVQPGLAFTRNTELVDVPRLCERFAVKFSRVTYSGPVQLGRFEAVTGRSASLSSGRCFFVTEMTFDVEGYLLYLAESQGKDPEQYIKRISEERRYEDVIDAMERQLERRLLGKWLPRNVTLIYYYTSESSGYPNFVFRFDGESF